MRHLVVIVSIAVIASVAGCGHNETLPTSPTTQPSPVAHPQTPPQPPPQPQPPASPPGTIVGIVKDDQGIPVADVVVSGPTVASTTTDQTGGFTLPAPACIDGHTTWLRFDKAGYLDLYPLGATCPNLGTLAVTIQPLILITADSQVDTTLFTHDPGYYVGDFCGPCKVITVHVDDAVTVNVHVQWSGATPLGVWTLGTGPTALPHAGATDISVNVGMSPSKDTQLVVGVLEDSPFPLDVPFRITTATVAAQ